MKPKISDTRCCALSQLSLGNNTNKEDLVSLLEHHRFMVRGGDTGKTLFAITTPQEKKAEKLLEGLGFKVFRTLSRLKHHGRSRLKMWMKTFS
jgi:hypothetical protein